MLAIYKVFKYTLPNNSISNKAMSIMNSFANDTFQRLATEAGRIAKQNSKATISHREVQTAVRLLLPGELGRHAVAEGQKCLSTYNFCTEIFKSPNNPHVPPGGQLFPG